MIQSINALPIATRSTNSISLCPAAIAVSQSINQSIKIELVAHHRQVFGINQSHQVRRLAIEVVTIWPGTFSTAAAAVATTNWFNA